MSSKKSTKLTSEKLRQYKGFENTSDEEAREAVNAIEKCARLFFEVFTSLKKKANEKQSS